MGGVDYGMLPVIRLLCVFWSIISCFGAQKGGFRVIGRFSYRQGAIISIFGVIMRRKRCFIGLIR